MLLGTTESSPQGTDVVRPEALMSHSQSSVEGQLAGQGGIQATVQAGMVRPELGLGSSGEEGMIPEPSGENGKCLARLSILWVRERKEAGSLGDKGAAPCMCLAHGRGSGSTRLLSLCSEQPSLELEEERSSESALSLFLLVKTMHTFSPLLKRFSFLLKTFAKKSILPK